MDYCWSAYSLLDNSLVQWRVMNFLLIAVCLCYALGTLFRAWEKIQDVKMTWHRALSLGGGLILHLILIQRLLGHPGVSLQEALLIAAGILALLLGLIELTTGETFFSLFVLPLSLILVAVSPQSAALWAGERFFGGWFLAHMLSAITGECFFLLATITGVSYLVVVRKLKQKNRLRAMYFFPPLARLDSLMVWFLSLGLAFFTVGIALGTIWSYQSYGTIDFLGPKRFLSGITVVFFSGVLIARRSGVVAGNRLAWLAIVGLVLSLGVVFAPDTHSHWLPKNAALPGGAQ